MAILDCLVLEVKNDTIKIIANDLEIGIETIIEGEIKKNALQPLMLKCFTKLLGTPFRRVSISVDTNYVMNINGGKANLPYQQNHGDFLSLLCKIVYVYPFT